MDMKQRKQIYPPSPPRAISFMGALASLLLHALLLTPAVLGTSAHKTPLPRRQDMISTVEGSSNDSTMTVIFIQDPDPDAKSAAATTELASLLPEGSETLATVAAPNLEPPPGFSQSDDNEEERHSANAAVESDPGRALLLGRYLRQITARIQRAWVRPRTRIESDLFVCRVRILQDHSGGVMEIELARCNGDVRWQTSLVAAIQSASPLPAPPDPDVFSTALTIEFTAEPFAAGKSTEGFEPESRIVMN
jgi:hypothetical protein